MVPRASWRGLSEGWLPMWAEARPRMAPSTLFMSCATPPAKVPRLSIFWDCWSWAWSLAFSSSARWTSVMSRFTPTIRTGLPSRSLSSVALALIHKTVPSRCLTRNSISNGASPLMAASHSVNARSKSSG